MKRDTRRSKHEHATPLDPELRLPIIRGVSVDIDRLPPDCLDCLADLPLLVARRLPVAESAAPMEHLAGCLACTHAANGYLGELAEAREAGEEDQLLRRWESTRALRGRGTRRQRKAM